MLATIVGVGGLLTLGITQIVRGSGDSPQTVVAWDFREWLLEGPLHVTPEQFDDLQQVVSSVQGSGVLVTGALSVSSSIGHFLAGLLLALFATLFILIDGRHGTGSSASSRAGRAPRSTAPAAPAGPRSRTS